VPEQEFTGVPPETPIAKSTVDFLAQIGIFGRPIQTAETVDSLSGRTVYLDLPVQDELVTARPHPDPAPDQYRVAAGRLSGPLTEDVVMSCRRLFRKMELNADGKLVPQSRVPDIAKAVQDAVDAYLKTTHATRLENGPAFRRFVVTRPEHSEAARYLAAIESLFGKLERLGLTSVELANAKRVLLDPFVEALRNVNIQDLMAAIEWIQ
jgi:hypothetical protein